MTYNQYSFLTPCMHTWPHSPSLNPMVGICFPWRQWRVLNWTHPSKSPHLLDSFDENAQWALVLLEVKAATCSFSLFLPFLPSFRNLLPCLLSQTNILTFLSKGRLLMNLVLRKQSKTLRIWKRDLKLMLTAKLFKVAKRRKYFT